jgi:hypothetical protein
MASRFRICGGEELPATAGIDADTDFTWQQVSRDFTWYSKPACRSRICYQSLKVLSLLLAAAVTVMAAMSAPALVTASAGAAIVVAEGLQQLFKFHPNWVRYRVVTETLREHAYRYATRLAPYDDVATAQARFGESYAALISGERSQWMVQMQREDKGEGGN